MPNFKFKQTAAKSLVDTYRGLLYQSLTAPIDAMWELLYISGAQDFLIEIEGMDIGYCSIDEERDLKQLFLLKEAHRHMAAVVSNLINDGLIASASLSSNEPIAFNACLLHAKSIEVNTFCYQHLNEAQPLEATLQLELVSVAEIPAIKAFLKEQVGMDDTFGYTENLVNRQEIYRILAGDTIIATSECRLSDTQPRFADLGMIVKREFRGQGLATQILKTQANRVLGLGRLPICSTTLDNKASQKAIERAGFYCSNIIFNLSF